MARWILDPGHGGRDSGAIGNGGRREKSISLDAALEAKRVLELNGEDVFLTRQNDIYLDQKDRITYTNEWEGDYYISFHMSYNESDSIEGTIVHVQEENSSSKELGEYLLKKLVKGLKSENKGIIEIDYGILRGINNPGVVLLGDFISNRHVERNFNGEHFGRLVANSLVQYIGKTPRDEGKKGKELVKKETAKEYGWRVCVGVYDEFIDAKKEVQNLKARGVSNVYIIPYIGKKDRNKE